MERSSDPLTLRGSRAGLPLGLEPSMLVEMFHSGAVQHGGPQSRVVFKPSLCDSHNWGARF